MSNIFHPYRGVFQNLRIFGDQLPAHNGNVPNSCVVICGFCQSTAVYKMGILHSKPCCPLIHLPYKFLLAASNMLCHCYTGVISRGDHNALDHSLHILGFPFLQKYLGATHRLSVSAGCYKVIHFQCTILQRIENQDQCHDLRNTCRTASCVRIFFVNHSTGTGFHQKG